MHTTLRSARRPLLPLLIGLAALAACDSTTAPALDAGAVATPLASRSGAGGEMVPFSDRQSFQAAADAQPLPCLPAPSQYAIAADRYVGTGTSSHLGRATSRLQFDACQLVGSGGIAWRAQGHSIHTAANGDELHATWTLTQYLNGDFVIGPLAFTGGTGRFATTTGWATGTGWIDRTTLVGTWEATGQITRPGQ